LDCLAPLQIPCFAVINAVATTAQKCPARRMNRYAFHLRITSEQYLDYYRGTAKSVVVRAVSGQTVQFPASLLQRFVSPDGIHGDFVLVCDDNHKCIGLQRVS
jgi:hypothetical protein